MGPLEKLVGFFSTGRQIKLKKGETIIRADETPQSVYYIVDGFIKIYSITDAGNEKILVIYGPGFTIPVVVILGDLQNKWYFEAMNNVTLLKTSRENFVNFAFGNPDVMVELTKKLVTVLGVFSNRIDILEYDKASARVIADLIFLATDFGKIQKDNSVLIELPITHKDIAARNAMTRETASRELSKLEKKRLVSYKKHMILITNMEKMRLELESSEGRKYL